MNAFIALAMIIACGIFQLISFWMGYRAGLQKESLIESKFEFDPEAIDKSDEIEKDYEKSLQTFKENTE